MYLTYAHISLAKHLRSAKGSVTRGWAGWAAGAGSARGAVSQVRLLPAPEPVDHRRVDLASAYIGTRSGSVGYRSAASTARCPVALIARV